MNDWQIARHQVSIAGRVIDAGTGKPVAHAVVYMSGEVPKAFDTKLAIRALTYGDRWHGTLKRPDRTSTRPDGLFYFLDLPDGKYELSACIPDLERLFAICRKAICCVLMFPVTANVSEWRRQPSPFRMTARVRRGSPSFRWRCLRRRSRGRSQDLGARRAWLWPRCESREAASGRSPMCKGNTRSRELNRGSACLWFPRRVTVTRLSR